MGRMKEIVVGNPDKEESTLDQLAKDVERELEKEANQLKVKEYILEEKHRCGGLE